MFCKHCEVGGTSKHYGVGRVCRVCPCLSLVRTKYSSEFGPNGFSYSFFLSYNETQLLSLLIIDTSLLLAMSYAEMQHLPILPLFLPKINPFLLHI